MDTGGKRPGCEADRLLKCLASVRRRDLVACLTHRQENLCALEIQCVRFERRSEKSVGVKERWKVSLGWDEICVRLLLVCFV